MARLILGHTTSTSIKVWIRAPKKWPTAFIQLFDSASRKVGNVKKVETSADEFFTNVVTFVNLKSRKKYKVKLSFGKNLKSKPEDRIRKEYTTANFQTFAASGNSLNFVFGSCNLHSLGIIKNPDQAWIQISKIAKLNQANFMVHCGDQIYADLPFKPSFNIKHYRNKYLDAWHDCIPAKRVLTELSHYMILDDHEIINNFSQDMIIKNRDSGALSNFAMKAYWEFQHCHNPDTSNNPYQYFYNFSYGDVQFFVLDTRFYRNTSTGNMIDSKQQKKLYKWLMTHHNKLKFIVSSVPFVGVVKNDENDKWCSKPFVEQRNEIISFIHANSVNRVCFLTGDMHNSYVSNLEIKGNGKQTIIYELMSSPINQVTPNIAFENRYHTNNSPKVRWKLSTGETVKSTIVNSSYYGNHSNIMAVEVINKSQIKYKIYRTLKNKMRPEKYGIINL